MGALWITRRAFFSAPSLRWEATGYRSPQNLHKMRYRSAHAAPTVRFMDGSEQHAMRALISAAETIVDGDYSVRLTAAPGDETGRRLAAVVNTLADDLTAAEQARRALIGNLSHELKTPLAALHALLENVADGLIEPHPATLALALSQTERLDQVVTDLLDLSTPISATHAAELELLDVRHWLTDLAAPWPRTRINVTPSTLHIHANHSRLSQVVTKVVEDALRNTPATTDILIEAHQSDNHFHLDIVDQRPDINQPERSHDAFAQFFAGGSTDGGTGLGLSVAQWATHQQGGTIKVATIGPGRHVKISLPTAPENEHTELD